MSTYVPTYACRQKCLRSYENPFLKNTNAWIIPPTVQYRSDNYIINKKIRNINKLLPYYYSRENSKKSEIIIYNICTNTG